MHSSIALRGQCARPLPADFSHLWGGDRYGFPHGFPRFGAPTVGAARAGTNTALGMPRPQRCHRTGDQPVRTEL